MNMRVLACALSTCLLTLACSVPIAIPGPGAASAATITVDTAADELNADGDCSLREAIQAANLDAPVDGCGGGIGKDFVSVPAGTYTLTLGGADDTNAQGDLDITGDLVLNGDGPGTTIVQAGIADRVLHVLGSAQAQLSGITIRNGRSFVGGGVRNQGSLSLTNVTVIDNVATSPCGGASAGGISNTGTLNLVQSRVDNNEATVTPGPGVICPAVFLSESGGGIVNGGTLNVSESSISHNVTTGDGGGIDSSGSMTVTGSSISFNEAALNAGGIATGLIPTSVATLSNTTIAFNEAGFNAGGVANYEGAALSTM